MIDIKKDFARKHREDVIDTLVLRARERRVLTGLLIILLLTLMYENGSAIFGGLLNENFAVATLGERKKITIRPDILKKIARSLDGIAGEYPQFSRRLGKDAADLNEAVQMAAVPELAEKAVDKSREVIHQINEFVSHPVIARNKKLEALEKELKQVAKLLQINLGREFEFRPVTFKKAAPAAESTGQRDLFAFN